MSSANENGRTVLTAEVKNVIAASPFLALATNSKAGQPHLIVVGKAKDIRQEKCLVFGVYKMNKTRKNIAETGTMQVAAVSGKLGFRLTGQAYVKDAELLFDVETVEALL